MLLGCVFCLVLYSFSVPLHGITNGAVCLYAEARVYTELSCFWQEELLNCFDSGDKTSECLTVEEPFVLNNFMIVYQRDASFAVMSIDILLFF